MPIAEEKDLYAVLGLVYGADDRQIKAAYRRLAKSLHPDVNREDAHAAERFKEVAAAYRILSDPRLRAEYALRCFGSFESTFAEQLRKTRAGSTAKPSSSEANHRFESNITI